VPEEFSCRGLSLPRIAVYACLTTAFMFVNKGGAVGNGVFFLVIAGMMCAGPMTAWMGFSCAVMALTLNTAFVAKTIAFTFSRVLSIALFSARFTLGGNLSFLRTSPYIAMTTFCLVAAGCSIASGYFTHIALMKVLVFWVGMTGFFAFLSTMRQRRIDTTEWFVSQAAAVVMLSVLALVLGVAQNFKGPVATHGLYNFAFYHSQTAGPIFALIMVYLTCVFLFAGHRNRWICIPLFACLAYGIVLTRSRTGVGTLVAGVTVLTTLALAWGRGRRFAIRLNVSRTMIAAGFVAIAVGAVLYDVGTNGSLTARIRMFIAKSGSDVEEIVAEDVLSSRTGLMTRGWQNFRQSPLVGIGFGVSTDQFFRETATILYAPVEKGFLPTALLEEVGVLGTTAFAWFVVAMFRTLVRARNIPGVAMFASLLVLNLGEAGLFALGGHAAFMWLFVLGGILLGDRCTTAVRSDGLRAAWAGSSPR
jgi:O-antigen ligase